MSTITIIKQLPDCPPEIISASEKGELVIFIGAGVSRLVNCLGWNQLAKNLIKRCTKEGLINFKTEHKLESIKDQRKIISICYKLFEDSKKVNAFEDEMKIALNYGAIISSPNIYTELVKVKALFVTTNADEHFDNLFDLPLVKYRIEDLKPESFQYEYLYHLHGSIKDPKNIVFRLGKYFEIYKNPEVKRFLSELFDKKTILFVGYGLAEFELLEYLSKNNNSDSSEKKHFSLNGYYSGEEDYVRLEQIYYNEMGIKIIPYSLDKNGFSELYNIIKDWVDKILTSSTTSVERFKEIDEAIEIE